MRFCGDCNTLDRCDEAYVQHGQVPYNEKDSSGDQYRRGPVVKEDDLIRALQTGEIGGAALDAVEEEPLSSDSPLWDMDNVIITPHCAADSKLYIDRAIALFCENLKLYEEGKTLLNEIDMKQRY